jgi:hypothetical protein
MNRRDKRAMNRIRKRHATLMLLSGMNENGTDSDHTGKNNKDANEVIETKKAKFFSQESANNEDNQMQKVNREQKGFN